jgi:hypothetical protein
MKLFVVVVRFRVGSRPAAISMAKLGVLSPKNSQYHENIGLSNTPPIYNIDFQYFID